MVTTDLCELTTADGETLHGLLFAPGGGGASDLALVYWHGVGHNFAITPLAGIARALAEQGLPGLVCNSRGHDWVARGGADGSGFRGAAYERMADAPLDLDAALHFLAGRGYRRFVLVGHSLGAVKVVHYQGLRRRSDVVGVVACSPPRTYYASRVDEQPGFAEMMDQAQRLVAEGRGDTFVWAPTGGSTGLFTAHTFVSKYGPEADTDIRPYAARLGAPLLGLVGGAEGESFRHHVVEIAEAARGTSIVIKDAGHSYAGYERVVIQTLATWLADISG